MRACVSTYDCSSPAFLVSAVRMCFSCSGGYAVKKIVAHFKSSDTTTRVTVSSEEVTRSREKNSPASVVMRDSIRLCFRSFFIALKRQRFLSYRREPVQPHIQFARRILCLLQSPEFFHFVAEDFLFFPGLFQFRGA